jgi:hypothetical protein
LKKIKSRIGYFLIAALPMEINRIRLLLTLWFSPDKLYLHNQMLFPAPNGRMKRTQNPLDDFEFIQELSDKIETVPVAHIVFKGKSFDQSQIDKLDGNIYLVNWFEKLDHPNAIYVTGDWKQLNYFVEHDLFPILFCTTLPELVPVTQEVIKDPRVKIIRFRWKCGANFPGSGLHAIISISTIARKLCIHGWDNYMPHKLDKFPSFLAMFGMMYFSSPAPNGGFRSQPNTVEVAFGEWLYAARLYSQENFELHGNLIGAHLHPKIMNRIEKIYYQND